MLYDITRQNNTKMIMSDISEKISDTKTLDSHQLSDINLDQTNTVNNSWIKKSSKPKLSGRKTRLRKASNYWESSVIKTKVRNVNLDCVKPRRAGIILYTVYEGSVYFGMGLDSRTHDLTDFGGGVSYSTDKNVINGALREFQEETLKIFEDLTIDNIGHCPVIYDSKNLIIFLHANIDPNEVCNKFKRNYILHEEERKQKRLDLGMTSGETELVEEYLSPTFMDYNKKYLRRPDSLMCDPEVCAITWLSWEDFQLSIKTEGIMFSVVQKFLKRADDFSYLL
jgi:hypothetical protein